MKGRGKLLGRIGRRAQMPGRGHVRTANPSARNRRRLKIITVPEGQGSGWVDPGPYLVEVIKSK